MREHKHIQMQPFAGSSLFPSTLSCLAFEEHSSIVPASFWSTLWVLFPLSSRLILVSAAPCITLTSSSFFLVLLNTVDLAKIVYLFTALSLSLSLCELCILKLMCLWFWGISAPGRILVAAWILSEWSLLQQILLYNRFAIRAQFLNWSVSDWNINERSGQWGS